jgi:hypothetical protein
MALACGLAVLAALCGPIFPDLPPSTAPPPEPIALGGGHPGALALAKSALWVTVYGGRGRSRVVAVDRITRRVVARVPVHGSPFYVAAGRDAVWVTGNSTRRDDVLYRIDPVAARVVATIPLPGHFAGRVAAGPLGLWILATNREGTREWLVKIDTDSNVVGRAVELPTVTAEDLAVGNRFVWLLALRAGRIGELPGDVLRFDPHVGRVTGRIDAEALAMRRGAGGLWISACVECGQYRRTYFAQRVDTRASRLAGAGIAVRGMAFGPLLVGREHVWFAGIARAGPTVAFSLDPRSGKIERLLDIGRLVYSGMAFDRQRRALWVSRAAGGVLRVDLAKR